MILLSLRQPEAGTGDATLSVPVSWEPEHACWDLDGFLIFPSELGRIICFDYPCFSSEEAVSGDACGGYADIEL